MCLCERVTHDIDITHTHTFIQQQMDGLPFPVSSSGEGAGARLSVSRADFSYKEEGANVHEGLGFDDHVRSCVLT